jgi:3-methylcrotonyl-CoA carboxylase alpha subunit
MSRIREISKVLVANRGEIACRVFRTCRKLGIRTVGVFSEPDANSQHVHMADEAYLIGPAASTLSYLNQQKIFEVAKRSGAQAIHPGYGFLSENYEFAKKCAENNVIFIGPPPQAIFDMGIKSKSKELMTDAGVPVVPGYHGSAAANDMEALKKEALKLGFPLMIKAVKGGGGKGMRIARTAEEFLNQASSCQSEAEKAFGDGALLIERYIEAPRHVEVQVFGDSHGNCVYLWERDCSVQRRHQKVIEEAPAPGLTAETRKKIGTAAVNAAKAVKYTGAGTVEFIVENQDFYFMEMNTRLQVEHPVTEAITGLDLVQWQLLVAMGHELPIKDQDKIPGPFGHAMEMRVYAEDTAAGFVPAPGLVHALRTPSIDCRVESAVIEGDLVSVHYDPMIAKLIVWGDNRIEAIHKADLALSQFNVGGVDTNIDFMRRILRSNAFQTKPVTTKFIEENHDELLTKWELTPEQIATATLAFSAIQDYCKSETLSKAFRMNTEKRNNFSFKDGEKSLNVSVTTSADNKGFSVGNLDSCKLMRVEKIGNIFEIELKVADRTELIHAALGTEDNCLAIFTRDGSFKIEVPTLGPLDRSSVEESGEAGSGKIKSPMPGTLEKVFVKVGDSVKKGQQIGTLVAMKMEHVIRSPCDGVVDKIYQEVGKTVPKGSNLFSVK